MLFKKIIAFLVITQLLGANLSYGHSQPKLIPYETGDFEDLPPEAKPRFRPNPLHYLAEQEPQFYKDYVDYFRSHAPRYTRMHYNYLNRTYFESEILDDIKMGKKIAGNYIKGRVQSAYQLLVFLAVVTSGSAYIHNQKLVPNASPAQKVDLMAKAVEGTLNDTHFWTAMAGVEGLDILQEPIRRILTYSAERTFFTKLTHILTKNAFIFVTFPFFTELYEQAARLNRKLALQPAAENLKANKITQAQYDYIATYAENQYLRSKFLWTNLFSKDPQDKKIIFNNLKMMSHIFFKDPVLKNIWFRSVLLNGLLKGDLWITLGSVVATTAAGSAIGIEGTAGGFILGVLGFLFSAAVPSEIKLDLTHNLQWSYRQFWGQGAGNVRYDLLESCTQRLSNVKDRTAGKCIAASLSAMSDARDRTIQSAITELSVMIEQMITLDYSTLLLEPYLKDLEKYREQSAVTSWIAKAYSSIDEWLHRQWWDPYIADTTLQKIEKMRAKIASHKRQNYELYQRISGLITEMKSLYLRDITRITSASELAEKLLLNTTYNASEKKIIYSLFKTEASFLKNQVLILIEEGFGNQFFGYTREHRKADFGLKGTSITHIFEHQKALQHIHINNLLTLLSFFHFEPFSEQKVEEASAYLIWSFMKKNIDIKSLKEKAEQSGFSGEQLLKYLEKIDPQTQDSPDW